VTLKVIDSIGCESEEKRVDHIKRYFPQVNMYSYDTLLCGRLKVNIYNSSYAYNATYLWDFGDGTTASTYHASHTYSQNGLYTIKLIVKDENNCRDSITRPAYIKLVQPTADFIVGDTSQCAPTSITFRDSSLFATSYHWFFDGSDGGTNKIPSPHIYGEPGYYKVTLAIKGVSDCVDTVSKIIHIKGPIAKLNAGVSNGCAPYPYHIGVTGTNIKSYAWDFGDGTPVIPSTDSAVNHLFVNAGKYLPNAILTSPEGCIVTLKSTDTVVVDELHADFTIAKSEWCDSATVEFSDKSSVAPFSSILETKWLFGNNDSATGPLTGPHVYKFPGTYSVSLVVTSRYGCTDTLTKQDSINIWESPQLNISGDSLVCLTSGSMLNYHSEVTGKDSITHYQWSIDGIPVSATPHLSYDLRDPGSHELKLTIVSDHSCSASATKTIFIDSIKTNFSIDAIHFCGEGTVKLRNETVSASSIGKATWDLGNGVTLNGVDTNYTYTVPGTYYVKLLATTIKGCSDSS
ncbi:MAG TPA: PKD domain-containing protein, partial [Bacteroidia bacterium]|nr:PKD domain-containing protein [Bacteroidia bacterium]